jgi:hypothetical protein
VLDFLGQNLNTLASAATVLAIVCSAIYFVESRWSLFRRVGGWLYRHTARYQVNQLQEQVKVLEEKLALTQKYAETVRNMLDVQVKDLKLDQAEPERQIKALQARVATLEVSLSNQLGLDPVGAAERIREAARKHDNKTSE